MSAKLEGEAVVTRDELRREIRLHLTGPMQRTPGSVLYTPLSNVKPAAVYIMGLNPGGDPKDCPTAIIDNIAPPEGQSGYTHECWKKHCREPQPCSHLENGRIRPEAEVKHQRHMRQIAQALEIPLIQLVCCNAIFAKSESLTKLKPQTGLNAMAWWSSCWPVHQYLLRKVRPRAIITLGYGEQTSAFGLLRREAGYLPVRKFGDDSKKGGRAFDAQLPLGGGDSIEVSIVGVPHPSWHAPGPILKHQLWEVARGMAT